MPLRRALILGSTSRLFSTAATETCSNPFLIQSGTPRYASLKPSFLSSAVDTSLMELKDRFKIVEDGAESGEIVATQILEEMEKARR